MSVRRLLVLLVPLVCAASPVRAAAPCPAGDVVGVLVSPRAPVVGGPLRAVAVAGDAAPGDVVVLGGDGAPLAADVVAHGGPPWSAVATVASAPAGRVRVEVRRAGEVVACRDVAVGERAPAAAPAQWDRATEDLYAAWIEHLFAAPPDEDLGFPSLAPVLRDPARNFLLDHLGLDEDASGARAIPATPDCADLPYFLRAYFAWKLGLPVGYRACSRGSGVAPPRCGPPTVVVPPPDVAGFVALLRRVADGVQSGNARTGLADDATDFYPLPLVRTALRPGTIYADPYGHTLVIVGWVPQTAEQAGRLLAVDAQPDQSVGRKRFWEGTFLFATTPSAGPGFKAFRPLVRGASGRIAPLGNAALARDPVQPFSDEQATLAPEAFYVRMASLIDPAGLAPERAYESMLAALLEQLRTRVGSVENGEQWKRAHPGAVVPMPSGGAIFETTGPWEDYSTPSRDLRLLIAMRVLEDLPARIERHPELFVLGDRSAAAARADVERLHARRVGDEAIEYVRSDGSSWRLTVADVLARRERLEVAYDPNDCVEVRWGAAEGSDEAAPCRRRAPAEQRAKMEEYRPWFREGRRPAR